MLNSLLCFQSYASLNKTSLWKFIFRFCILNVERHWNVFLHDLDVSLRHVRRGDLVVNLVHADHGHDPSHRNRGQAFGLKQRQPRRHSEAIGATEAVSSLIWIEDFFAKTNPDSSSKNISAWNTSGIYYIIRCNIPDSLLILMPCITLLNINNAFQSFGDINKIKREC